MYRWEDSLLHSLNGFIFQYIYRRSYNHDTSDVYLVTILSFPHFYLFSYNHVNTDDYLLTILSFPPLPPLRQRCCALFVSEVLKRCVHKEMTVEYRAVAVNLQEEVMIALLCPTWPLVAILHDQVSYYQHHLLYWHSHYLLTPLNLVRHCFVDLIVSLWPLLLWLWSCCIGIVVLSYSMISWCVVWVQTLLPMSIRLVVVLLVWHHFLTILVSSWSVRPLWYHSFDLMVSLSSVYARTHPL